MKNAYTVVQPFRATTAISGRDRQFLPGEAVLCDPAQAGETVIIEVDEFLFLTDRSTFESCCQWKNEGLVF
jgi:hypothetical protein